MNKKLLNKPVLISLYGYPGSGKSYIARNLVNELQIARVSADRVRHELFKRPRYDAQENVVIAHLMNFIAQEFLRAGLSVVYDVNAMRISQRHKLRELAKKHKAEFLLVWLQTDPEFAFERTHRRDKRNLDDKYSEQQTKASFERQVSAMQNPQDEEYIVISAKHGFDTQKNTILNYLYKRGIISGVTMQKGVTKPELVNLIPAPQIMDPFEQSRRSISISEWHNV